MSENGLISFPSRVKCARCHGTGIVNKHRGERGGSPFRCGACDGEGYYERPQPIPFPAAVNADTSDDEGGETE